MNGVWRPCDVSAGSDTKSLLFKTGIGRKLDSETRFECWRDQSRQSSYGSAALTENSFERRGVLELPDAFSTFLTRLHMA